jgi:hypothetical protein
METRDKRYWQKTSRKLMSVWRERVDFLFDDRLQNYHDDDDDDDDDIPEMKLLKNEECFITEVKQPPADACFVLEDIPVIENKSKIRRPLKCNRNLIV